ncbi:hypothetical protein [Chryseobacterium sp.]|uniref:hypothetical protein n=1 Tax=Chryseobacterium sp. TaxID=1871047 RepID=UPI00321AF712
MFILRKMVCDQQLESNTILGDLYNVVSENNKKDWDHFMERWKTFEEDIYLFIVYRNGSEVMPLYKKQANYIMTSDGKTFCNLTYK